MSHRSSTYAKIARRGLLAAACLATQTAHALPRPPELPFVTGEKSSYQVVYFGATAGELHIEVLPPSGKAAAFDAQVSTDSIFSLFYKLKNVYRTSVDPRTGASLRFVANVDDSRQSGVTVQEFDQRRHQVKMVDDRQHAKKGKIYKRIVKAIAPATQDAVSAIFHLRTLPYSLGKRFEVPVFIGEELLKAQVEVVGEENLPTKIGRLPAYIIKPSLITKDGKLKEIPETLAWIGKEGARPLLKLKTKVRVGSVIAYLSSYVPGRTEGRMRPLGNSGLRVSSLAFGGNVFGWTADEPTSFALLDAFVGAGGNLIDTADVYSCWAPGNQGGESETILGRWLRRTGQRTRVVIATKVGLDFGPGRKGGLSPAHIRRSVDESLARLQTDYIDLYQCHRDDPDVPLAETLGALGELVRAGKVRAIGASNYGATRLREALRTSRELGLPRFESLQPLYNLYDRAEFERELAPLCVEENLGVITYFSLAAGFLTGKYRGEADLSRSPRGQRTVALYLNERGRRILAALDEIAAARSARPAQIALAWLRAQPAVTAPISSATSPAQLTELMGSLSLELSAGELAQLAAASAPAV